jgi:predicted amidophosphoribosyltransferase
MARQGKCPKCRMRWNWSKEIPLKELRCPQCSGPLKRTSYLSHLRQDPAMLRPQAI